MTHINKIISNIVESIDKLKTYIDFFFMFGGIIPNNFLKVELIIAKLNYKNLNMAFAIFLSLLKQNVDVVLKK